jgi:hypothetical protein
MIETIFFLISLSVFLLVLKGNKEYRQRKREEAKKAIRSLVENESDFRLLVRFSVEEVEKLTEEMYGFRWRSRDAPTRGHGAFFNPFELVTIHLFQLANYETLRRQAHRFYLSINSLHADMKSVQNRLLETTKHQGHPDSISPITEEEMYKYVNSPEFHDNEADPFRHCIYIVDGAYFRRTRPQLNQALYYSLYKGFHAYLVMLVIDFSGRIRYLRSFPAGAAAEKTLLDSQLNVRLFYGLKILGDAAYVFSRNCVAPYQKPQLQQPVLGAARKKFNVALSKRRILVEHVIGVMKKDWKILQQHQWHGSEAAFKKTLQECAVLTNRLRRLRNRYQVQRINHLEVRFSNLDYEAMGDDDDAENAEEEEKLPLGLEDE